MKKTAIYGVYASMFKHQPRLRVILACQTALLILGRAFVAGAAWVGSKAVDAGGAPAWVAMGLGAVALYAVCKAMEWLLSAIHTRIHAHWVLPEALEYVEKALGASLSMPDAQGLDPVARCKRLDRKGEARSALGMLFHHIAPPVVEMALCAGLLAAMGFGWLGWALIPAALANVIFALRVAPKIKGAVGKALVKSEKAQSSVAKALEKAALARAYGTQSVLAELLARSTRDESAALRAQALASDAGLAVQSLGLAATSAIFFALAHGAMIEGSVSAGAFSAFIGLSASIFSQLKTLGFAFDGMISSTEALKEHAKMLSSARPIKSAMPSPLGDLHLDHWVALRDGKSAFSADRFAARAGEKIYVCGASGAGKSSWIMSLAGLCGSSGQMMWNGLPWVPGDPGVCAYMPQDGAAMSGSIRDNLRLGKSDASDERMMDALRAASLWDRVLAMGGLDAQCEWRGSNMSGGEMQRLALARSIVSGMPLLLLDEPTSGLDAINEAAVIAAVESLKDRSAIICVHRIRAIPKGSRVMVLESGRIVEDGLLEDLIERGGSFSSFWNAGEAK